MNVLVVGNGGREHALAWKLNQSSLTKQIFVAPGNAGTASECENVALGVDDIVGLISFAKKNNVGLVVVGPEAPLCNGIVDAMKDTGLTVFGPTKAAAQLEGSKAFCKNILRTANVPTADFQVLYSAESAERYINERFPDADEPVQVAIKADGLAAGKGVVVCDSRVEAMEAIDRIGRRREFGTAGNAILIEEKLVGQEASILAITDGKTIIPLPAAQDHKPAYDNDTGPNTGGMGAYSPAPQIDQEMFEHVQEHVLIPTVHTMKRNRTPFFGVLYAGLMLTNAGPKVLEYNVRFGDPECQAVLMRLKSDLAEIMLATAERRLSEIEPLEWDDRPSVCVVMASEGYPGNYSKGHEISGLDEAAKIEDVKVFHAGTAIENEKVFNTGGRVLSVTALGESISNAKLQAYKAVKCIRWKGAWCRKDISDKALAVSMNS